MKPNADLKNFLDTQPELFMKLREDSKYYWCPLPPALAKYDLSDLTVAGCYSIRHYVDFNNYLIKNDQHLSGIVIRQSAIPKNGIFVFFECQEDLDLIKLIHPEFIDPYTLVQFEPPI